MFMESLILQVSWEGLHLLLKETRSIHDSMKFQKLN